MTLQPCPSPKSILLFCQTLELLYELAQWPGGEGMSSVELGPTESQGPGVGREHLPKGSPALSKEYQVSQTCVHMYVVSADECVPWEMMKQGRLPRGGGM